MKPGVLRILSLLTIALSSGACTEIERDSPSSIQQPSADRPDPVARVILDGEVFEFWPYACASKSDGSPYITGVRQNPDGSPVEEQVPLSITGRIETNDSIGVVPYNQLYFRYQGHDIYLWLSGEDHTLIDDQQMFRWKGVTQDNQQLKVEVICPWLYS